MDLSQKLKEARIHAGMKQEELAHSLGVSRQTISNWENGRSLPDIASMVKLSGLYGRSLDEMLKEDSDVLKAFEDLAAKRRKFWQMMLEIGIILELLAYLFAGQSLALPTYLCLGTGIALTYLAIVMHLRVFDHDREEIARGLLGVAIHMGCNLLALTGGLSGASVALQFLRIGCLLLIWSAGVFTIDWKSTRLWLIIALYLGTPLLNLTVALQDAGTFNEASPLGGSYRVAQVLYPEGMEVPEYTKIEPGALLWIEDRDGNSTNLGPLHYVQPVEGQTQKGIWQLIPEEAPDTLYKVTVEADDSIHLSYYEQETLQWKWLLTDYGRQTCFIQVATFGSTMSMLPQWYAPGREDPNKPGQPFVVGSATLDITVAGLPTQALTLIEEYHYGDTLKTTTHTLDPKKPGAFTLELKTRYEEGEQWALYRIPYEDGEYRFCLGFD